MYDIHHGVIANKRENAESGNCKRNNFFCTFEKQDIYFLEINGHIFCKSGLRVYWCQNI